MKLEEERIPTPAVLAPKTVLLAIFLLYCSEPAQPALEPSSPADATDSTALDEEDLVPDAADLEPLPAFDDLPVREDLPDPLETLDGSQVRTSDAWWTIRRPEIERLFEHYMLGVLPDPPSDLEATVEHIDEEYFGGEATLKLVTLDFGPSGTPPLNLLLVVPNARTGSVPVFVGPNFFGNHSVLDDPVIPLSTVWLPDRAEGVSNNGATEAARGTAAERWPILQIVRRGYGLATFYHGDLDPDFDDFTNGVHPYFSDQAGNRGKHEWGAVGAWAWGVHRVVDYLVTDADIDDRRIAVMGHSRNGKAALFAGALDLRIALVVSNQSGCSGAALSRRHVGETVQSLNWVFPHWFDAAYQDFNENEARLPFDQHMLLALIAPRPLLVASAEDDSWADPEGEFLALAAASSVYELLGAAGLSVASMPATNTLVDGVMGYHIREGDHGVGIEDWTVFMDYADARW